MSLFPNLFGSKGTGIATKTISWIQLEDMSRKCEQLSHVIHGFAKQGLKRHLRSIWKDTSPENESLAIVPSSLLLYAARHAEKMRKWESFYVPQGVESQSKHGVGTQQSCPRATDTHSPHHTYSLAVPGAVRRCPENSPWVPVGRPRLPPRGVHRRDLPGQQPAVWK